MLLPCKRSVDESWTNTKKGMIKADKYILGGLIILALAACSDPVGKSKSGDPVDLVNPYMGNISHLLVPTFPTIHLPNSMMRVSPARGDFTAIHIHGLPVFLTSHRDLPAFNLSPFQGDKRNFEPVLDFEYDREKLNTPFISHETIVDEGHLEFEMGPLANRS